jgi:CBS domain-containing protein
MSELSASRIRNGVITLKEALDIFLTLLFCPVAPQYPIMVKKAYYCSEHQSVDEAREIMREHHLQYLPVVDGNMHVVGMVALRDLAAIEQRRRNK